MVSEIFRTYINPFFAPTSLIGIILIVGCVLLWKNKIKPAKIFISLGVVGYVLCSLAPLRFALYSLIESSHEKVTRPYKYVVVLGAKTFYRPDYPISSQLSPSLMARVIEGVRLVHENPESILIVTGNGAGEVPEANLMYEAALALGIAKERIIVDRESMNTKDHPVYLKPILKNEAFVMVTSAYHMERAIKNFRTHGLNPIPMATDYINKQPSPFTLENMIMRGENFAALDRWVSEMYSRLWTFIRMTFA
jgi:uncharacterized SAM-binding protein YcdF (DUF218 family)